MRSFPGLLKAYWISDSWKEAWALTLTVALLTAAASKSGVWLAEAAGTFLSAIASFGETNAVDATHAVLAAAGALVGLAFLKLAVFIGLRHFFSATLHRRWRRWLDRQFNAALLDDRRAYYHLLVMGAGGDEASGIPDNIDQRIQESIKAMTGSTLGMAMGLFTVITSVYFVGEKLIENSVPIRGFEFLGSYGTFVAVLALTLTYVPLSTLFALHIGRMLETLNNAMQKYEGSYRAELAMLVRRVLPVAAARGEAVQISIHRRHYRSIDRIWGMQNRVSATYIGFNQFYNFITQRVVAYLPNLAAYMQGSLSFRNYVTGSELVSELINECSWLIQVMPDIANLRANANRVIELADAIDRVQNSQTFYRETGINAFHYDTQPAARGLSVRGLELMFAGHDAHPFLSLERLDVRPGDWLFVRGPSGAGKSCLIKALNGLWPYGRGRISFPDGAKTLYACQDTRLPQASLKELIAMPGDAEDRTDAEVATVMEAAGIGEFATEMNESTHHGRRWDDVLSGGQKQKIVLARILLNRPRLLFLDEATAALDPSARDDFHRLIRETCPNATVISVMHVAQMPTDEEGLNFYTAVLDIEDGHASLTRLPRRPEPATQIETGARRRGAIAAVGAVRHPC